MRRRWLIGPALGLALLCVLVATAPARLLPALLPPGQLSLQGMSGTLWQGAASRALLATAGGALHLGRVEWRFRPLSLLLFAPAVEFTSTWGAQNLGGTARLLPSGDIDLEPLEARFDSALFSQLVPVRLVGSFVLQLQELRLRDGLPSVVQGRVVWENGGWNSPQGSRPLGDYALDLRTGDDGLVRGEVITLSGEVEASGEINWRNGGYALDILLEGPGLSDPQLAQALQLLAAPEDGGFRLQLEGKLRP